MKANPPMAEGPFIYRFEIVGQPPRKSNNRVIRWVYRSKSDPKRKTHGPMRPIVAKSDEAIAWVNEAIEQVPEDFKLMLGSLEEPLGITFFITYRNERPDLSAELICDMLQDAGMLKDDRYLREKHLYWYKNKERQGVKILLFSSLDDPILIQVRDLFLDCLEDRNGSM